ncbi:MAG: hypothetical protein GIW94_07580 [Candidatus Eremiobacteraeota bacterium]|nr:hypothetical protein [Candidatus Eremiobacteraeota bacterium]
MWLDQPNRQSIDLGTLGGSNSAVAWPNHNESGLIAGIAETPAIDKLGESWSCAAFFLKVTHHVCRGFMWRNNVMTPLPTLGGINGYAAGTNNVGQIVGWAENTTRDRTCTGSQVLQFKPAYWSPDGRIHQLPTLPGDPDGAATATNNQGQIVGISGTCDQAVGRYTARHAVIWHDGTVTNLGKLLGGVAWNTPTSINNRGDVVGFANLPGGDPGAIHPQAFLWTASGGVTKLGALPGDQFSIANGINDRDQIVGVSFGGPSGLQRAFLWQHGVMTDLNTLVLPGSHLYLNAASDINDRGAITGQATLQGTNETPGFLAVPRRGT